MELSGRGIDVVTVFADDLDAMRRFYEDGLGLPLVSAEDDAYLFRLGSTLVNVLAAAGAGELVTPVPVGAPGAGARALFTIQVVDVDAECAVMANRGVTLLNGPLGRPWGVRTAAFADPAGNVWELAQPS